jgi:uroporphyrinogen-III synthase
MHVDLVPEEYRAEGLATAFDRLSGNGGPKRMRILLPRAESARDFFPHYVRSVGGHIDTPPVYRTVKPKKQTERLKHFLFGARISIATFTSSATFTNFLDIVGDSALPFLKKVTIAVIGPVTKKTIEKAGLKVNIMPETSTIEAMVEAIINWGQARKT